MEDGLLTYLRFRGRKPALAPAAEPAAWAIGGQEASSARKSTLPYPLSALLSLVENHKEYPVSCRQLAALFKELLASHPLDEVLLGVVKARLPRIWMERFLLILLEVEPSDWQTAAYVLQFRHLKRLLFRVDRRKTLNACEANLARELIQALGLTGFADLDGHCQIAHRCFQTLRAGVPVESAHLGLLIYLIRCEVVTMEQRKHWLEGELSGNEPEVIARLNPHLTILEERISRARELAQRLGTYSPIQDAPMGMETALGPPRFAHLRESLGRAPELARLQETLELQQQKRVPTRDLVALATLCRWSLQARRIQSGPLDWIHAALSAYDHGHFRLNVQGALPALHSLLAEAKVEITGTLVMGNFGENCYSSWEARDGLTRPYHSASPNRIVPDIRAIVAANLHREGILLKLLDNPGVYGAPGMVEAIVEGSRSPAVHSKIGTRSELHGGPVNGRVPVALLRSPVSIPTAVIRTLIHPSRIPLLEMKNLLRFRSSLRAEVVEELTCYLTQTYRL